MTAKLSQTSINSAAEKAEIAKTTAFSHVLSTSSAAERTSAYSKTSEGQEELEPGMELEEEEESPFQFLLARICQQIDKDHLREMDQQAAAFDSELTQLRQELTMLRYEQRRSNGQPHAEEDMALAVSAKNSQPSTQVPEHYTDGTAPELSKPVTHFAPLVASVSIKRDSPSCASSDKQPRISNGNRDDRFNSVRSSYGKRASEAPDNFENHVLFGSFKDKLAQVDAGNKPMITGRMSVVADMAVSYGLLNPLYNDDEEDEDTRRELSRCTKFCKYLTSGNFFEFGSIAMIFLNTFFIGMLTQFEATSGNEALPAYYHVLSLFFSVWFVTELSIRFGSEGLLAFMVGGSWRWNLFDSIIVFADVLELILDQAMPADDNPIMQNSTAFRILRLLRVCRALRVIKFIHFFKNFRIMVMAFVRSGWTLFWALLLLLMIIYVFSIYLTQNVTAYLRDYPDPFGEVENNLKTQFGSLEQAGYTLFKAISGGVSWEVVSDSLFFMDAMSGIGFIFYIFFSVFSLLNIITGVFVDTAISSAQNDDDEVIQAHIQTQDSNVRQLTAFFQRADADNSGELTLEELRDHFKSAHVAAQFATMGIAVSEAGAIFRLLDADGSGSISINEFVFGCLRMKGNAKSLDLQTLMFENKKLMRRSCRYYETILTELQSMRQLHATSGALFPAAPPATRKSRKTKTSVDRSPGGFPPREESQLSVDSTECAI